MTVELPTDLMQLPPSRHLKGSELGSWSEERLAEARVLWLWFTLFQELSYRSLDGGAAGRVSREEQADLLRAVGLADGRVLLESKLMQADGEDWICPRFIALNGGIGSGRSREARGGDMKAFYTKQRRLESGGAMQMSLLISGGKFVDGEGQALDPETVRRVTRLIVTCDNALFKPERPPAGFTEGLIQSALAVLKRYTDEEIDMVCSRVAKQRTHPALSGLTAEKLLPQFGEVLAKL